MPVVDGYCIAQVRMAIGAAHRDIVARGRRRYEIGLIVNKVELTGAYACSISQVPAIF